MFEGLLQPSHLLVILGVALFVLGPKKLPEMGKGLGEGIRGFKAALKSEEEKPKPTEKSIFADHAADKPGMSAIDSSLQAIQTAFSQLDQTAKRIASVAEPASSDQVDLSAEMVNLLGEKNQVATSVKTVQTVDEMQTNLLNILA